MQSFELHPVDTLFFRDARPMQAGAGSGGHGANWPLPTVLHEALRSHLLRTVGEAPVGKIKSHVKTSEAGSKRSRTVASDLFRSLRTIGPFPRKGAEIYLPMPLDAVPAGEDGLGFLRPLSTDGVEPVPPGVEMASGSAGASTVRTGRSNLPASWLRAVVSPSPPRKSAWPDWVCVSWYRSYLGGAPDLKRPDGEHGLFDSEPRIGVAIDPESGSAEDGRLYASEHLRLREGVSLWCRASLSDRGQEAKNNRTSLDAVQGRCLTLGGEGRIARLLASNVNSLDHLPKPGGRLIKWVLLTPAVFRNGWRPNWIGEEAGCVLLRAGDTKRAKHEDRKTWRERISGMESIRARLVAARVAKPLHFSGWDVGIESEDENGNPRRGGPKPTLLAVPAGSVFYFEADDETAGDALVDALHLRTRSDFFGEKGMGYGVCGTWKPADVN